MRALLVLGAALAFAPLPADAQYVEPRRPVERTELGGRVHMQMSASSVDSVPATEFILRRARIWAAARLNDWIDAAVQVDIAKGEVVGRYAFIRFEFDPGFIVTTGQFKRAFDVFELTSSSQLLAIERDGNIPGVTDCTGVGGVCSYSRFSEKLQYASVDVGVLIEGDLADGRLSYGATLTNGGGGNTRETNDSKSVSGRVEWYPAEKLRIGGNYSLHDYTNEITGTDDYAPARAFDVEWGNFDEGLHVQLGMMAGDNWRAPTPSGSSPRFLAYQGIATYKSVLSNPGKILAIEPIGRVSWGDPDRRTARDGGWLMTPGVILHFTGRNRLAANVDVWKPHTGVTAWGLKVHTSVYF
jgi:hypothetical protein